MLLGPGICAMSWLLYGGIVSLLVLVVKKLAGTRRGPFPPGPKPKPLIGNLLDLPSTDAALEYIEWGKKYGSDILYVSALGNHVLALNKLEDADELLEKRSQRYSDRPWWAIAELAGWTSNTAVVGYGEEWRLHRRICQQNFHAEAAVSYHPIQIRKVHVMLRGLLQTPEKFEYHNKMLSIGIPMTTMYGYEVESIDDPCIAAAKEASNLLNDLTMPGSSLMHIMPFLRYIPSYFPGASSHKIAAKARSLTKVAQGIPMDSVQRRWKEGTAVPSLVSNFLEKKNTVGASEKEQKAVENVAFAVYGAASDTTITATSTFFYCMLLNPDVQRKAQQELDRVVGSDRLPTFEDRSSMPYIEAVYREVMRWRPPLPLAIPHRLVEDDYYKGYFIPEGTLVFPNIWAMTHDETVYPDPFTFKPERFINPDGCLNRDDRVLAYGFGRRTCVGKHVASSTMWLIMASVLATFNITKAKDQAGNEIDIDHGYTTNGIMSNKNPFECSFTPRSPGSRKLVEETAT